MFGGIQPTTIRMVIVTAYIWNEDQITEWDIHYIYLFIFKKDIETVLNSVVFHPLEDGSASQNCADNYT